MLWVSVVADPSLLESFTGCWEFHSQDGPFLGAGHSFVEAEKAKEAFEAADNAQEARPFVITCRRDPCPFLNDDGIKEFLETKQHTPTPTTPSPTPKRVSVKDVASVITPLQIKKKDAKKAAETEKDTTKAAETKAAETKAGEAKAGEARTSGAKFRIEEFQKKMNEGLEIRTVPVEVTEQGIQVEDGEDTDKPVIEVSDNEDDAFNVNR